MKLNIFDVVELKNRERAIIVENTENNVYKARIVDKENEKIEIINTKDISEVISRSNFAKDRSK